MTPPSGDRIPTHIEGEALERAISHAELRLGQGLSDLAKDFNGPGSDSAWHTLVEQLSKIKTTLP